VAAWKVGDPRPPRPHFNGNGTYLGAYAPSLPKSAPPAPSGMQSVQRFTLVRFEAQDAPFEYSLSSIHGTLLGGMQLGPTPPPRGTDPSQPITLQEHFDAGWSNWLGGMDDWKVDAAGVRTGSLALFAPSLEMADYDLEFLARIENHSVSWVFRAAGFDDFHQATLAVAPNGYELTRRTFIGGVAETATGAPVMIASSGKSTKTTKTAKSTKATVTVGTSVSGNTFSISLDGNVIDTWTDPRLALGGIGFVGAPDDRARLYWIKLTPAGQISKEHRKQ
jgi:hypothetical protein